MDVLKFALYTPIANLVGASQLIERFLNSILDDISNLVGVGCLTDRLLDNLTYWLFHSGQDLNRSGSPVGKTVEDCFG